ncbi:unnamed protein product [Zymoseptoria tritici ST99CH_1A5]|uniref:Uncharacterized protein n=3 Tax=Zymoseptoria tritici TaxID=1047171 RepID=A0A1X7RH59_ZYMT9|nr:unnamed protein product [Zymoseptoria tritici ST99CH_3D7]SMR43104.1 unnamed protein product [Zymoseptoria tritici ST99CH_1E4]SMR45265.1 unnamed protein product [Zymoseptoria tritici ST99CH_3D1]SMY20428.1 unnamed protein product [Zymoseptoria tritici ST99CH_1A5]
MRVPNMKVVQTHSTVPDASIFTTTIFEALPPFAAAQATPAVDVTSHGKSFRFGAVGRRPQMHTPSPTTPDHTTPEQTSEAIEVRSPEEISDTEKRQVQAANPCPSGLQYIKCSDGSFEGCGNKNICAINATTASGAVASTTAGSQSTRRTTTAPSSTAPGIQTATRGSSTTAPSSTTSDSTAPTPSPSSSSKPSVGGIAGGAVGGILAILALLCLFAFLFRRHRRTIEKRRAASLPTNNFPSKSASYRDKPRQHNRSMSTANDVFAFVGKVAGGAGGGAYNAVSSYTIPHHTRQRSIFRSFPKEGEENYYDDDGDGRISPTGTPSDQRSHDEMQKNTLADSRFPPDQKTPAQQFPSPGLRAEGGPGLPPAAFLRPVPMLDGREIHMMGEGRVRSELSGKRSSGRSRFREEGLVEMEDTSRTTTTPPPPTSPDIESPILGHPSQQRHIPSISSTLSSPTPRNHHLMSWSTYSSRDSHAADDENFEMTATMTPKRQPGQSVEAFVKRESRFEG